MSKKKEVDTPQYIKIIDMVMSLAILVVNQLKMPFIKIFLGEQEKVIPMSSQEFDDWIRLNYMEIEGGPALTGHLKEAKGHLNSLARTTGSKIQTYLRNAYVNKSSYIDLINEQGQVVKIDKDGWSLATKPEVYFTQSPSMAEIPLATGHGDFNELVNPYLNLEDENARYLLVTSIVSAFFDLPSKPFLLINGEQGSAKSTTTRIIGELLDPSSVKTMVTPSSNDNLMLAAANCMILRIDNGSKLSEKMMNIVCQLSTGLGFRKRKLYSDVDEIIFEITRMVILNGIESDLVTAPDLLSRCIQLHLPSIGSKNRLSETKLWANFYRDRPAILGALYDIVSKVIAIIDDVVVEDSTRLTDFCRVGVATEKVMGWPEGSFMNSVKTMQAEAMEIALDADVLAVGVKTIMERRPDWSGTAEELLRIMNKSCSFDITSQPKWPTSARALGIRLTKVIPPLRDQGIDIQKTKSGVRTITITNSNPIVEAHTKEPRSDSLSAFEV
jgi:hypothetical protein